MSFTCFCPGPSQVMPALKSYLADAFDTGVLSMQHRSPEFVKISRNVITLLQDKLAIPDTYHIFYTSSATECWEIITEAFSDWHSYHFFSGAFGERWYKYRHKLQPQNTYAKPFSANESVSVYLEKTSPSFICLTQNETSNTTQLSQEILQTVRHKYPDHLIAIDAVSSFGGIVLDWNAADIWFTSVQKCLGLPAGLGLLLVSERAMQEAFRLEHNQHYNSLLFLHDKMTAYQTTYTPNVLGIYLLMRTLQDGLPIEEVSKKLHTQATIWYDFLEKSGIEPLISNKDVRSKTVIGVRAKSELLPLLKEKAKANGFILGNGYGKLKESSFRIANFPAIASEKHTALSAFLSSVKF